MKVVSEASGFLRWLISISWQVHEHLKKLLEFPPPPMDQSLELFSVPSVAMRSEIKEAMDNLGNDSFGPFFNSCYNSA